MLSEAKMSELIDTLMSDYDPHMIHYKGVVRHGSTGLFNEITFEQYLTWEALLAKKLFALLQSDKSFIQHEYHDDKAKEFLSIFLEYYQSNHRTIKTEITDIMFPKDELYFVTAHWKQTITDKLRGKLGEQRNHYSFLLSHVISIRGTSIGFECYLDNSIKLIFGGDGIVNVTTYEQVSNHITQIVQTRS